MTGRIPREGGVGGHEDERLESVKRMIDDSNNWLHDPYELLAHREQQLWKDLTYTVYFGQKR